MLNCQKDIESRKQIINLLGIAEKFNNFITKIGPKFAKEIEILAENFEVYLEKTDVVKSEYPLRINKFKESLNLFKITKAGDVKLFAMLSIIVLDLLLTICTYF